MKFIACKEVISPCTHLIVKGTLAQKVFVEFKVLLNSSSLRFLGKHTTVGFQSGGKMPSVLMNQDLLDFKRTPLTHM